MSIKSRPCVRCKAMIPPERIEVLPETRLCVQCSQAVGSDFETALVTENLGQPLVMVVDDDHDLCANLWDLLRDRGYRVCHAHDEKEAVEYLKGREFRVVLIDMKLPASDGASVFHLVRKANPRTRTVVITGHRAEMDQMVQKIMDEGADAVCYKPFDVPNLLATLKQLSHDSTLNQ